MTIFLPVNDVFWSSFNYFSITSINNVYCMSSKVARNILAKNKSWINNTNQTISVTSSLLELYRQFKFWSLKKCSLFLDQALLIYCAKEYKLFAPIQFNTYLMLTYEKKKIINILFHILKKWLFTLVTKFVFVTVN